MLENKCQNHHKISWNDNDQMKKENGVLFIINLIFPIIIESDYDYYIHMTGQELQMISIYIAIILFYRS